MSPVAGNTSRVAPFTAPCWSDTSARCFRGHSMYSPREALAVSRRATCAERQNCA